MPSRDPVVDAALPARGELGRDQRGRQQEDDGRHEVQEDAGQAVDGHGRRRPQAGHRAGGHHRQGDPGDVLAAAGARVRAAGAAADGVDRDVGGAHGRCAPVTMPAVADCQGPSSRRSPSSPCRSECEAIATSTASAARRGDRIIRRRMTEPGASGYSTTREVAVGVVEPAPAVLGDRDDVLDPDAEPPGEVDAGLDGEAHARARAAAPRPRPCTAARAS